MDKFGQIHSLYKHLSNLCIRSRLSSLPSIYAFGLSLHLTTISTRHQVRYCILVMFLSAQEPAVLHRPFVQAMLTLTVSKQPLLELRGARGLGRIAFKAPFYCPNSNKTLLDTKAGIAQSGGVPALIGSLLPLVHLLMIKLHEKHTSGLAAVVYKLLRARAPPCAPQWYSVCF